MMKLGNYDTMEKALRTGWCSKARRTSSSWPNSFVFTSRRSDDENEKPEIHCRLKNGYTLPYSPSRDDRMATDWEAVF